MVQTEQLEKPDTLTEIMAALEEGAAERIGLLLSDLHPAEIATLIESIPAAQRPAIWAQVDPAVKGEALLELSEPVRADLAALMDPASVVVAARNLDIDDIADLLPELSDEAIAEVLFALDKQNRQRLDAVMSYADDTAGGLMNVDAVTVRENITIEVVLRYLRRLGEMPDSTDKLFVVDRHDRLSGELAIAKLLTSDPAMRVAQVMERDVVQFPVLAPQKEVADAFEDYDLISAPVVDDGNRLLGRITVDDVVDVLREEAEHSLLAPAGLTEEEDVFAPVIRSGRHRAVWLGVNLLTALLASWVISLFAGTIQKVVTLAVLMPIVASMGGNAGLQTVTIVIRGLALGTITEANARRVLVKELLVGALNGVLWASAMALVVLIWQQQLLLALVIAMAMVINLGFAALCGVLIPILIRKLGIDPPLASGVILTTVTDVVGFFAFLGLATLVLV
ncbi:MAG: magnesium transporter [Gammaproteobacteria bacterium]|nr:magnesium transporter [Gammaproteobacteria bacterium]